MKHDENKDLRSISKIGKVDYSSKALRVAKSATIGIHMWGKIDFLTKYCGWHLIWDGNAGVGFVQNGDSTKNSARAQKKSKKEPKLTDKTKKVSKKK